LEGVLVVLSVVDGVVVTDAEEDDEGVAVPDGVCVSVRVIVRVPLLVRVNDCEAVGEVDGV